MVDNPLCEICGVRQAEYVCRDCHRIVCKSDYDFDLEVCKDCSKKYLDYYPHQILPYGKRRRDIWKPTLLFIFGIVILFFFFAILIYPETGVIYLVGNLPIPRETLIVILTIVVYPLILLVILGIFIKYIWLRTLS